MTQAPPMHIPRAYPLRRSYAPESNASTENSESVPYASDPTYPYAGADYQPQYAPQSDYGHAPPAGDPYVPMPAASPAPGGAPYDTTSPQYHPGPDAPYEPPEQTRDRAVPQDSRSRLRKPFVSQGMDASDRRLHDSRAHHPLFRHSRCTGKRKALCVRLCT